MKYFSILGESMKVLNVKQQKAKYATGSSVYFIYCKNGKYYVHDDIFEVGRVSIDSKGYHYSLRNKYDDHIDWCYEEDIFTTKSDATLEAAKRNF